MSWLITIDRILSIINHVLTTMNQTHLPSSLLLAMIIQAFSTLPILNAIFAGATAVAQAFGSHRRKGAAT